MKNVFVGVALLCLMLVGMVGCQTTPATSAPIGSTKYIMVTPTNGGSYTVVVPADNPDNVQILAKPGTATCAECIQDAKTYALTGKIDPVCKMCGAHREVITPATPSGHN